jgi:GNAT superfamily N-acetyltransferase
LPSTERERQLRLVAQARFDGSALYNGMMDLALVEMLDGLAAKAVPAEEVQVAGGWLARRSAGLPLQRANSVFPRGASAAVEEDVTACECYYRERGLPTRFQISPASQPRELAELLLARGYRAHSSTATYICALADVARPTHSDGFRVELMSTPRTAWWSVHDAARPITPAQQAATNAMFERIAENMVFALVTLDGAGAGVGMSVLEEPWFGIFYIATSPAMRRRGVGRVVVEELMQWARSHGAQRGYVQVEATNDPALALYQRAGYAEHVYDYQYLSDE